jgi:hypothetical protein
MKQPAWKLYEAAILSIKKQFCFETNARTSSSRENLLVVAFFDFFAQQKAVELALEAFPLEPDDVHR